LFNDAVIIDRMSHEYGAADGMRIGKGNPSTRRKSAPVSLYSPLIPQDLTWGRNQEASAGSRRLTTWAVAWRDYNEHGRPVCNAVQFRESPTFRSNMSPPSLWSKNKPWKKQEQERTASSVYLPRACTGFLLGFLYDPEDEGVMSLRNFGLSPNYTGHNPENCIQCTDTSIPPVGFEPVIPVFERCKIRTP
jgi:hypothetical protein